MIIPLVRNHRWPIFLLSLGIAFLLFTAWTFQRAAAGVSAVSDPNYYEHGLGYGSVLVEGRARR